MPHKSYLSTVHLSSPTFTYLFTYMWTQHLNYKYKDQCSNFTLHIANLTYLDIFGNFLLKLKILNRSTFKVSRTLVKMQKPKLFLYINRSVITIVVTTSSIAVLANTFCCKEDIINFYQHAQGLRVFIAFFHIIFNSSDKYQ